MTMTRGVSWDDSTISANRDAILEQPFLGRGAGSRDLHGDAMAVGVLAGRSKELIALAIALVDGCDGCIAFHAQASAIRGATEPEVAEALGVALLMAGGPASVEAPRAFQAFREFRAAQLPAAVGSWPWASPGGLSIGINSEGRVS